MTVTASRLRPLRTCPGCGETYRMLSEFCGDCEEERMEMYDEDQDWESIAEERAERMERRYESW